LQLGEMSADGFEIATFDGAAEGGGSAPLQVVPERLPQDRPHDLARLATAQARRLAYALGGDQRGYDQRRRERAQSVIKHLGFLADLENFSTQVLNDSPGGGDGPAFALHGEGHGLHEWRGPRNERHHGMKRRHVGSGTAQRGQNLTGQSSA